MASPRPSAAPRLSTPPPPPIMKRAVTLPMEFHKATRKSKPSADDGKEILFSHRLARIIAFKPVSDVIRPERSPARRAFTTNTVGILPYASRTEQVLANGPLEIYRNRSQVSFIQSGQAFHVLFAKSQCWCVDGECKFVFQISNGVFWRVELPGATDGDRLLAKMMEAVLSRILMFEKTPCPFKRGFTVDLPEPPATPVKQLPWKAPERTRKMVEVVQQPDGVHSMLVTRASGPLVDEFASVDVPKSGAEIESVWESDSAEEYTTALSDNQSAASADDSEEEDLMSIEATPRAQRVSAIPADTMDLEMPGTPTRPKALEGMRSIMAPPQLSLAMTPPSRRLSGTGGNGEPRTHLPTAPEESSIFSSQSMASSVDSFHSFLSNPYSLPPSPPDSNTSSPFPQDIFRDADIRITRRRQRVEAVVQSMAARSCSVWDEPLPEPPKVQSRSGRLQQGVKSRGRAISPVSLQAGSMDPAVSGHHLLTAMIQKACSVLLGSPRVLSKILLHFAHLIREGTFVGVAPEYGDQLERMALQWETSRQPDDDRGSPEADEDTWAEDDYGVPLSRTNSERPRRRGVRNTTCLTTD